MINARVKLISMYSLELVFHLAWLQWSHDWGKGTVFFYFVRNQAFANPVKTFAMKANFLPVQRIKWLIWQSQLHFFILKNVCFEQLISFVHFLKGSYRFSRFINCFFFCVESFLVVTKSICVFLNYVLRYYIRYVCIGYHEKRKTKF